MFDAYKAIFEKRGQLYNRATRLAPAARSEERDALISRLDIEGCSSLCDVPAGGGYLADGIRVAADRDTEIICVEPSPVFAADLDRRYGCVVGHMEHLPLSDACVDRVGSLAGMHHLEDKVAFLRESVRILKPGGALVLADVRADTDVARFLNGPVDRLSATGHDGRFLTDGEISGHLDRLGLIGVEETYVPLNWRFPDRDVLVRFCRDLFGLTEGSYQDVASALEDSLPIVEDGDTALGWGLMYVSGRRPW